MKKFSFIFLILFISYFGKETKSERIECQKRFYPELDVTSFVCVCNSTYCDTVESVDTLDPVNTYQEFITSSKEFRLDKFRNKFQIDRAPGK